VESAIFLFTRRVLTFFRGLKVLINPISFIRSACFDLSSGQSRVNPGKQEGGGREKNQSMGEFSFRGNLQPTMATNRAATIVGKSSLLATNKG